MGWSSFYPVPPVFPKLSGIKINPFLTAANWFLSALETSQLSFVRCAMGLRPLLLTPLLHPEKQTRAAGLCLQGPTFHKGVCLQTPRLGVSLKAWMNRNVTSWFQSWQNAGSSLLALSQRWPEVYTFSLQARSQCA